jgi:hypothetical protein
MNGGNESSDDDHYVCELVQHLEEILGSQVQQLSIEVSKDGLTLYGFCDSFHFKQMAQEAASRSTSRRIVENKIVVREYPE